jgi:hypothetical protein
MNAFFTATRWICLGLATGHPLLDCIEDWPRHDHPGTHKAFEIVTPKPCGPEHPQNEVGRDAFGPGPVAAASGVFQCNSAWQTLAAAARW